MSSGQSSSPLRISAVHLKMAVFKDAVIVLFIVTDIVVDITSSVLSDRYGCSSAISSRSTFCSAFSPLCFRSGILWTQKLRSPSVEKPEVGNVLHLNPGVGQNTATCASLLPGVSSLS